MPLAYTGMVYLPILRSWEAWSDTCRGAKEVGILASLVEGEGSTYTSVNFPSLLFIDRIFGIDEGGILLVLIVARTVSTEDDGGPTQGKRKFDSFLLSNLALCNLV